MPRGHVLQTGLRTCGVFRYEISASFLNCETVATNDSCIQSRTGQARLL